MKIEAGKEYMTADSRRVKNVRMRGGHLQADVEGVETSQGYRPDGRWGQDDSFGDGHIHLNIVSEVTPTKSPFREVRRREFIDGTYAKMAISKYDETRFRVGTSVYMNAAELREAAHLLNQLAEFLENDG